MTHEWWDKQTSRFVKCIWKKSKGKGYTSITVYRPTARFNFEPTAVALDVCTHGFSCAMRDNLRHYECFPLLVLPQNKVESGKKKSYIGLFTSCLVIWLLVFIPLLDLFLAMFLFWHLKLIGEYNIKITGREKLFFTVLFST